MEREQVQSIIFIYTCPSGSKIKERMIYASMKRTVMDAATSEGGFEIVKKVCGSTRWSHLAFAVCVSRV